MAKGLQKSCVMPPETLVITSDDQCNFLHRVRLGAHRASQDASQAGRTQSVTRCVTDPQGRAFRIENIYARFVLDSFFFPKCKNK